MKELPTILDFKSRPESSRQAIRDYVQRAFPGRFVPVAEDDSGGKLSILFTESGTQLKFAFIPAGQFVMGLSVEEENAARRINPAPRIDAASMRPTRLRNVNAFLMSMTPVLIGDWLRLGGQLDHFGLKGLFAAEWCSDLFVPDYHDTTRPRDGEYAVRGAGSVFWPWQDADEWVWCISANRYSSAELPEGLAAFRVVYDIR